MNIERCVIDILGNLFVAYVKPSVGLVFAKYDSSNVLIQTRIVDPAGYTPNLVYDEINDVLYLVYVRDGISPVGREFKLAKYAVSDINFPVWEITYDFHTPVDGLSPKISMPYKVIDEVPTKDLLLVYASKLTEDPIEDYEIVFAKFSTLDGSFERLINSEVTTSDYSSLSVTTNLTNMYIGFLTNMNKNVKVIRYDGFTYARFWTSDAVANSLSLLSNIRILEYRQSCFVIYNRDSDLTVSKLNFEGKVLNYWVRRTAAANNVWSSVTWSPTLGLYVAVSRSGTNRIMISSDGIKWSSPIPPNVTISNYVWNSVLWVPALNKFVAVGDSGAVSVSSDGYNWTDGSGQPGNWNSLVWAPSLSLLVVVGDSGAVMTSANGNTWTAVILGSSFNKTWNSVTWSSAYGFVAIGNAGAVMTSPNGTSWTISAAPVADWSSVTWSTSKGLFVAVGGLGSIMTSVDGTNWISRSGPFANWTTITETSILGFVALGSSGGAMISTDGINWSAQTIIGNWNSVVYGSGLVVAVGDSGAVMSSIDDTPWSFPTIVNQTYHSAYLFEDNILFSYINSSNQVVFTKVSTESGVVLSPTISTSLTGYVSTSVSGTPYINTQFPWNRLRIVTINNVSNNIVNYDYTTAIVNQLTQSVSDLTGSQLITDSTITTSYLVFRDPVDGIKVAFRKDVNNINTETFPAIVVDSDVNAQCPAITLINKTLYVLYTKLSKSYTDYTTMYIKRITNALTNPILDPVWRVERIISDTFNTLSIFKPRLESLANRLMIVYARANLNVYIDNISLQGILVDTKMVLRSSLNAPVRTSDIESLTTYLVSGSSNLFVGVKTFGNPNSFTVSRIFTQNLNTLTVLDTDFGAPYNTISKSSLFMREYSNKIYLTCKTSTDLYLTGFYSLNLTGDLYASEWVVDLGLINVLNGQLLNTVLYEDNLVIFHIEEVTNVYQLVSRKITTSGTLGSIRKRGSVATILDELIGPAYIHTYGNFSRYVLVGYTNNLFVTYSNPKIRLNIATVTSLPIEPATSFELSEYQHLFNVSDNSQYVVFRGLPSKTGVVELTFTEKVRKLTTELNALDTLSTNMLPKTTIETELENLNLDVIDGILTALDDAADITGSVNYVEFIVGNFLVNHYTMSVVEDIAITRPITLPIGDYTITHFLTTVRNQLNAVSDRVYSYSYSVLENKATWSYIVPTPDPIGPQFTVEVLNDIPYENVSKVAFLDSVKTQLNATNTDREYSYTIVPNPGDPDDVDWFYYFKQTPLSSYAGVNETITGIPNVTLKIVFLLILIQNYINNVSITKRYFYDYNSISNTVSWTFQEASTSDNIGNLETVILQLSDDQTVINRAFDVVRSKFNQDSRDSYEYIYDGSTVFWKYIGEPGITDNIILNRNIYPPLSVVTFLNKLRAQFNAQITSPVRTYSYEYSSVTNTLVWSYTIPNPNDPASTLRIVEGSTYKTIGRLYTDATGIAVWLQTEFLAAAPSGSFTYFISDDRGITWNYFISNLSTDTVISSYLTFANYALENLYDEARLAFNAIDPILSYSYIINYTTRIASWFKSTFNAAQAPLGDTQTLILSLVVPDTNAVFNYMKERLNALTGRSYEYTLDGLSWRYFTPRSADIEGGTLEAIIKTQFLSSVSRNLFLDYIKQRFNETVFTRDYSYVIVNSEENPTDILFDEVFWSYIPLSDKQPESTTFVFSDADPNTIDTLLGFSIDQGTDGIVNTMTSSVAINLTALGPPGGDPLKMTLIENDVTRYSISIPYGTYTITSLLDAVKTALNNNIRTVSRIYNYSYDSSTGFVTWSFVDSIEINGKAAFAFDNKYTRNLAPMLGFQPIYGKSVFKFSSLTNTLRFSFNELAPQMVTEPSGAFGGSFFLKENLYDVYLITIPSSIYTLETFFNRVKTELNSVVRPSGKNVLTYDYELYTSGLNMYVKWIFEGEGSAAFSFENSYDIASKFGLVPGINNEVFSFGVIQSNQAIDLTRLVEQAAPEPAVGLYIKKLDENGLVARSTNVNSLEPAQSLLHKDGYRASICLSGSFIYVVYTVGSITLTDYFTFTIQKLFKDTFSQIWSTDIVIPDGSLDTVFPRLLDIKSDIHLFYVRNNNRLYARVFETEFSRQRNINPYDLGSLAAVADKRELKIIRSSVSLANIFYIYLAYPSGNNITVTSFLSDTYALSGSDYWIYTTDGGSPSTPKTNIIIRENPQNRKTLVSYTAGGSSMLYSYFDNTGGYFGVDTTFTGTVKNQILEMDIFDDYAVFFGLTLLGTIRGFKIRLSDGVRIGNIVDTSLNYPTGPLIGQFNRVSVNAITPWDRLFIGRVDNLATSTYSLPLDFDSLIVGGGINLVVQTGLSYLPGNNLFIIPDEAPAKFIRIVISTYNSVTGSLTGTVKFLNGTGIYSDWKLSFNDIVVDKLSAATSGNYVASNEVSQYQSHIDADDNIYPIYYAGADDGIAMTKFTADGNPILQRSFTLYGQTPAITGDADGSLVVAYTTRLNTFITYLAVSLRKISRETLTDIWTYSVLFEENPDWNSITPFRPRVRIYGDRVFTAYKTSADKVYIQVNRFSTGQLVKHIDTGYIMTADSTELVIEPQNEKIVYIAFPNGGNSIQLTKYNIETGSAIWNNGSLESGIVGTKSSIILRYNQNLQTEFLSFDSDLSSSLTKTEMAAVFESLGVEDRSDFVWNLFGLSNTETLSYDQFVRYMYPNNPLPGLPLPDKDFFGYREKNGLYVSYTNNGSELRLAKIDQLDGSITEWSIDTGITDVYGGKAHAFYISNNVPLVFAIENKNWGVTWVSDKFVAVGSDSSVMTSSDGIVWTAVTAQPGNWNSVVWASTLNLLVAVGSNGSVMSSPDGTTWTLRTAPVRNWNSVTWSSTTGFVAVGSLGATMRSTDGVSWSLVTSQAGNWNHVTWASGLNLLVAVGSSGALMTSSNGTSWNLITLPSPLNTKNWNSSVWAGGSINRLVVVGDDGSVMTSTDGSTNWVAQTLSFLGNNWNSVTWSSTQGLIAVGARGAIMTSTNSTTWTLRDSPEKIWNSVATSGSVHVAVSSSGSIARSVNTTSWQLRPSPYTTTPNISVKKFYAIDGLPISTRKKELETFDTDLFIGPPAVFSREFWDSIWLVFPDPTGSVYENWAILVNKLVAPAVPEPSETYVKLSDKQFLTDCDECVYVAYVSEEGPNTVSISKMNVDGIVEHVKDLEIGGQSPTFIVYNDEVIYISFVKKLVSFSDFIGLYTMSIDSESFETNWRTERLLNDTFVEYFKPMVERTSAGVHVVYFRQDGRMYIDTYKPDSGLIDGTPYASSYLAPETNDLNAIQTYMNEVYTHSTEGYLYVARLKRDDYSVIQITKHDPTVGLLDVWGSSTVTAGTVNPKSAINMKTSKNDLYTSVENILLGYTDNASTVYLSSLNPTDGSVDWTTNSGMTMTNVYQKRLHNMQVTGGFTLMFFVEKQASNVAVTTVKFDDDGAIIDTRKTEGPDYQELLGSYVGQYSGEVFPAPVPPYIIEYELDPDIIIGYPYIICRQPWKEVYMEFYTEAILTGLETTTPRRLGVVALETNFSYGITNVKSELSDYQLDSDPTKITYVIYNDTDIGGIKLSKMSASNVELLVVVVDPYGENPSIVLDGNLVYVTYVRKQFGFAGASVRVVKKYNKDTLDQDGSTIEYYYLDSNTGIIQPRLTKTAEKLFVGYKRQDDRIYIEKIDKGAFEFELIKQLDEDFSTVLPGDIRLRGLEDNISLLYTGISNSVLRRFSPSFVQLWSTTIERALAAKMKEDESIIIAYRSVPDVLRVKSLNKNNGTEEWTSNLGLTNIIGTQVSNIYLIFGYTLTFCVNNLGKMVVSKFMRDGTFVSQVTSDLPGLIAGNIQDFPVTISRSSWNTLTLGYYSGVTSELEISPSLWIAIKNFSAITTIPTIPAVEVSDNQVDKDGIYVYAVHNDDANRLLVTKHLLTSGAIVASYLLNTDGKPFSPSLRYKEDKLYVSYVKYEIGYTEIVELVILTLRVSDLGLVSRVSKALADPSQATFRPRIAIVDTPTPFNTTATTGTGSLATITTSAAHGLSVGDQVTVSGVVPTGYNGTYTVVSLPTTTTFTYFSSTTGSQTTPGTVAVGPYLIREYVRYDNVVNFEKFDLKNDNLSRFIPVSVNIASVNGVAGTVTVTTTTPHGFVSGDTVKVLEVVPQGYNGIYTIVNTPSPTQFTYSNATTGLSTSVGRVSFDYAGITPEKIQLIGSNNILQKPTVVSIPISSVSGTGSVATVTTVTNHGLKTGDRVIIDSVVPTGYNGMFVVTGTPANNQFTYASLTTGVSTSVGKMSPAADTLPITSISGNGNSATITVPVAHEFVAGDKVEIAESIPSVYNGVYTITNTPASNQITYAVSSKASILTTYDPIESITGDGTTVVVTTTFVHGLKLGDKVAITEVVPGGFNGAFTVTGILSLNQFTYSNLTVGSATGVGSISPLPNLVTIASVSGNGTTVTVNTVEAHGYLTGDKIGIMDVVPVGFNGVFTITRTSLTQFTYLNSTTASQIITGKVLFARTGLEPDFAPVEGYKDTLLFLIPKNSSENTYKMSKLDGRNLSTEWLNTTVDGGFPAEVKSNPITKMTQEGDYYYVSMTSGPRGLLMKFDTTDGSQLWVKQVNQIAGLTTHNHGMDIFEDYPMVYTVLGASNSMSVNKFNDSGDFISNRVTPLFGMNYLTDVETGYTPHAVSLLPWQHMLVLHRTTNPALYYSATRNLAVRSFSSGLVYELPAGDLDIRTSQGKVDDVLVGYVVYYNQAVGTKIFKYTNAIISGNRGLQESPGQNVALVPSLSKYRDQDNLQVAYGKSLLTFTESQYISHRNLTATDGFPVNWVRRDLVFPDSTIGNLRPLIKTYENRSYLVYVRQSGRLIVECRSNQDGTLIHRIITDYFVKDVKELVIGGDFDLFVGYVIKLTITGFSGNGTVVTVTTSESHGLDVGDEISIADADPSRIYTVTGTPSLTQFTYNDSATSFPTIPTVSAFRFIKFSIKDEEVPFEEEWSVVTTLGNGFEKRSLELAQNVQENLIISFLALDPLQNEHVAFNSNVNQDTGETNWTQQIYRSISIAPTERLNGFGYEGSYSNTSKIGTQIVDDNAFTIDIFTYDIDSFGSRIREIKDKTSEDVVMYNSSGNPLVMFNKGGGFGIIAYVDVIGVFRMERYISRGGAVRAIFDNEGRATHPAYPGEYWWRPYLTIKPTLQGTSLTERTTNNVVDANWQSVVWTGDRLLAVGPSSGPERAMVSNLGLTWSGIQLEDERYNKDWSCVIWAEGLGLRFGHLGTYVAVSRSGTIMISIDGSNWQIATVPVANHWTSVAWSPELGGLTSEGLLVAVASGGDSNRVVTSTDGLTWSINDITISGGTTPLRWNSIAWSKLLGKFVAVASSGTGKRVMTSSDGKTWELKATPADYNWVSVKWSSIETNPLDPQVGLFIAVASSGENRVMTSFDGESWTIRTVNATTEAPESAPVDMRLNFTSITWAKAVSRFIAVAKTGTVSRILSGSYNYSTNEITWIAADTPAFNDWTSVTWAEGLGGPASLGYFVAVASSGIGNRAMISEDGLNWRLGKTIRDVGTGSYKAWHANGHFKFEKRYDQDGNIIDFERSYLDNGQWIKDIDYGPTTITREFTPPSRMNMNELFRRFDKDADGYLTRRELVSGIRSYALNVPDLPLGSSPLDKLFARMDSDGDGRINFTEFSRVIPNDFYSRDIVNKIGYNRSILTAEYTTVGGKRIGTAFEYASSLPSGSIGTSTAVVLSGDGQSWASEATPLTDWASVAWSPTLNLFAAVGTSNSIQTSPDGNTWTTRNIGSFIIYDWNAVVWAPELNSGFGLFVTLGNSGAAGTSTDGVTWIQRFTPRPVSNWASLTWAPSLGLLVAVGSGGAVMTSEDGTTWSMRTAPVRNWTSVIWSPEKQLLVAVGDSGAIMTSINGINWSLRTGPTNNTSNWKSVTWAQSLNMFVVVGDGGAIMRSSVGTSSWTYVSTTLLKNWRSIVWAQSLGKLIVLGTGGSGMTSVNASTWTETTAFTYDWSSLVWAPSLSLLVAVGSDNSLAKSSTGTSWTEITGPINQTVINAEFKNWKSVIWVSSLSLLVAVGSYGATMSSSNGTVWARPDLVELIYKDWTSVTWAESLNLLVAVGTSGAAMTSPNGLVWTDTNNVPSGNWNSVTWSPNLSLFVAVGTSGAVMTSTNGTGWTLRSNIPDGNWLSVVRAQALGLFVAVGTSGSVMTSSNGTTWTKVNNIPIKDWNSVTWSPSLSMLVAVGNTGAVMTSSNGTSWTLRTAPVGIWNSVIWSPEKQLFVAIGNSGALITSTNGTTWVSRPAPANNWTSVAWAPGLNQFVAVVGIAGNLLKTSNYKDGMLNGLQTFYNPDGSIQSSTVYSENRKTGTYTEFYPNEDDNERKLSVVFNSKGYETPVKSLYSKNGWAEYISETFSIRTKPKIKVRVTNYWSESQIKSRYYLDAKKVKIDAYVEYDNIKMNSQGKTSYTFALKDTLVTASNSSAQIYTIPTNSSVPFVVGKVIRLFNVGSGALTVQGQTGVTVSGTVNANAGQALTLTKTAVNTWTSAIYLTDASYTFVARDVGNVVIANRSGNQTYFIPLNASVPVPVGGFIKVFNIGPGNVILQNVVGVTFTGNTNVNTPFTNSITVSPGECITLSKRATNTWYGAYYQTGLFTAGQKTGTWETNFESPRFYEVKNAKRVVEKYVRGRLSGVKAVRVFDASNVEVYFKDYPVVT